MIEQISLPTESKSGLVSSIIELKTIIKSLQEEFNSFEDSNFLYQRLIDKYLQTDKIELTKAKIERTLRPCSLTKEQIERIRILILQISLNTKYKLKFTRKAWD